MKIRSLLVDSLTSLLLASCAASPTVTLNPQSGKETPYPANLTRKCPDSLPFPEDKILTLPQLADAYSVAAIIYHKCKSLHNDWVDLYNERNKP